MMSHECVLSTSKLVGLSVAASGKSVLSCTIRLLVLGTFDVIKLNELGWFYSIVDTMSILLLEKKKKKLSGYWPLQENKWGNETSTLFWS